MPRKKTVTFITIHPLSSPAQTKYVKMDDLRTHKKLFGTVLRKENVNKVQ